MFTTWTRRKKIVAVLSVPVVALLVLFAVIVIDGEGYDRWRNVHELRNLRDAWLRGGSPEPPDVTKYAGGSSSSTSFVYTASHLVGSQTYTGLFAHRSHPRFGTWVITRTGEIIVVDDGGHVRLARVHKTRAAAW